MSTDESKLYTRPTVKRVIFQVKFSNLFWIKDKIGDFQAKIMNKFPESSIVKRSQFLVADVPPNVKSIDLEKETFSTNVWQFTSKENYVLSVLTNSLDITSTHHKSFHSRDGRDGFKDIIKYSLEHFTSIIPIETLKYIGLRYIDECPLPPMLDNDTMKQWYNTVYPFHRFNINDSENMQFETKIRKNQYHLIYREKLLRSSKDDSKYLYILDYDASCNNVKIDQYLDVLEDLYHIIHDEWEKNTIKEPVIQWMSGDD
ncbi:MAG: TIGR04255 family protein [Promethearchaeota archaeon]